MQSRLERRGVFGARGAFRLVKPIEDVRSGAKSEFWPRLRIGLEFGFRLGLGLGFLGLRLRRRLRGSLGRALGRSFRQRGLIVRLGLDLAALGLLRRFLSGGFGLIPNDRLAFALIDPRRRFECCRLTRLCRRCRFHDLGRRLSRRDENPRLLAAHGARFPWRRVVLVPCGRLGLGLALRGRGRSRFDPGRHRRIAGLEFGAGIGVGNFDLLGVESLDFERSALKLEDVIRANLVAGLLAFPRLRFIGEPRLDLSHALRIARAAFRDCLPLDDQRRFAPAQARREVGALRSHGLADRESAPL